MSDIPSVTDTQLEISDRVATLKLNRNDVRNALTGTAIVDDILKVTQWLNSDSSVSCLIITGKSFNEFEIDEFFENQLTES